MQLYATPLSHFSRKVRLLLDAYGLDYQFVDIGNVADKDVEAFQGNPLMKVPVLRDGGHWLIESDHIAAHIVRSHDPQDRYRVLTTDPQTLNMRAVMNGVMADEVKLILAERTGLDTAPHAFFQKARAGIGNGLAWLEGLAMHFDPEAPGYLEFHLVSLWEHIAYYETVALVYPKLQAIVDRLGEVPLIRQTAPFVLKPRPG